MITYSKGYYKSEENKKEVNHMNQYARRARTLFLCLRALKAAEAANKRLAKYSWYESSIAKRDSLEYARASEAWLRGNAVSTWHSILLSVDLNRYDPMDE